VAATRRLAAVMFTDIVGYTTLAQFNEAKALQLLHRHNDLIRSIFPRHRGREIKTIGDSFLLEFDSAVDATECAIGIQRLFRQDNATHPPEECVRIRIGIHLGDVIHTDTDVLGDAVNIASRIEPLAEPEGVCVSGPIYEAVHNKLDCRFEKLDPKPLKNVQFPPAVYRALLPWSGAEAPLIARTARNRIAVLPFANMSPDPDDAYFADGITEELIATLAEVPGLRVVSRTSVEPYKQQKKSLREIGSDLHVDTVLEGSVRKIGDQLRITVQLIQTDTDERMWSARYDRKLENVFEIQTEVARTVAENLRIRLNADVKEELPTQPEVTSASRLEFLKGVALWRERTKQTLFEAKECYQRAIALDERNARAYAELAAVLRLLRNEYGHQPSADPARSERALIERALEIDPGLAEAHAALGALLIHEYRWPEAERELTLALSRNPNYVLAHNSYGILLQNTGRFEAALREWGLAEETDPLYSSPLNNQAELLTSLGRFDEARAKLQRLGEISKKGAVYQQCVAYYALATHDFPTALGHIERLEALEPERVSGAALRGIYFGVTGQREKAEELLRRLKDLPEKGGHRDDVLAKIYATLGDRDECFRWLERGFGIRAISFGEWRASVLLADVVNDPRFQDLLERANLK
jgi:adenylate cyclase